MLSLDGQWETPILLQGTLDLLILHALQRGPLHGYAIAQTIHLLSDEVC
jgi:PadR family transcriptional regulator, regulatory protein PadR